MKRNGIEKHVQKVREKNAILSRRVANRLLGIRRFAVSRECKHGFKAVSIHPTLESAMKWAGTRKRGYEYYIEEIFD